MRAVKIDTNIPVPGYDKWNDYPFHKLEVGHSFFKEVTKSAMEAKLFKWRLENDIKLIKKFKMVEMHGGVRVWRTK